jgi:hypothetical protein
MRRATSACASASDARSFSRIAVAVLVGATCGAKPDVRKIPQGIELSFVDFRDVLMNEYDNRIDYKAALRRLGLYRPYAV